MDPDFSDCRSVNGAAVSSVEWAFYPLLCNYSAFAALIDVVWDIFSGLLNKGQELLDEGQRSK